MSPGGAVPHRVLVGGTGSGKKAAAAALFRRHGLRPLAMDSMKVYRGMDVGTDKPTPEVVAETGYGLLDLVGHDESFSAGRWVEAAVAEARASAGPLLFAGGTPLYLRLLLRGLFPGPPADPPTREQLDRLWDEQGEGACRAELARVDPALEARLLPGDRKRILRGLEVWRVSGRALSDWQREETRPPIPGRFVVAALRPEPGWHAERIAARARAMFAGGLLDEVAALRGRAAFAPEPGRSIGYAEALAVLDGALDAEAACERVVVRTRQLIRKQRMFLASFPEIRWVDVTVDTGAEALIAEVERALELA